MLIQMDKNILKYYQEIEIKNSYKYIMGAFNDFSYSVKCQKDNTRKVIKHIDFTKDWESILKDPNL